MRILLWGSDPLLAWSLAKEAQKLGIQVEHVFTLAEALYRLSRKPYEAMILEGLHPSALEEAKGKLSLSIPILFWGDQEGEVDPHWCVVTLKDSPMEVLKVLKNCLRRKGAWNHGKESSFY